MAGRIEPWARSRASDRWQPDEGWPAPAGSALTRTVHIIGPGCAGMAFATALADAGWKVPRLFGREDDVTTAAEATDLVLIATPDAAIADVAANVAPAHDAVIAHLSGACMLGALAPHEHRLSIHPLVAIPAGPTGAARLRDSPMALAASSERAQAIGSEIVGALGGTALHVADDRRVAYHAAAAMASNHLVALLGQVERVAATAGVPLDAYLALVRATVDNVAELGPAAALTGPVARGDWATVAAHISAIDVGEHPAYIALAAQARRLVDPEFDPCGGMPLDPEAAG